MNSDFPLWLGAILAVVPLVVAINAVVLKSKDEQSKLLRFWVGLISPAIAVGAMVVPIFIWQDFERSTDPLTREAVMLAIAGAVVFGEGLLLSLLLAVRFTRDYFIRKNGNKSPLSELRERVSKLETLINSDR